MIRVNITGLTLYSKKTGFVLLLRSTEDRRTLPIFIGAAEAQSIAYHLSNTKVPRPLTHDLLKTAIESLGGRLKQAQIHTLEENTFHARLIVERIDGELELDARPSDAIALAIRCQAPIYVARVIMDKAGVLLADDTAAKSEPGQEHVPPAPTPSPIEALQQQMDQAVREERYEDAARFRDEIRRLQQQSHN